MIKPTNKYVPSPQLPTVGPFPLSFWAESFGCRNATIRDWLREYDIPHCEIGRKEVVIFAEDWWAAFPRRKMSELAPKKRGGARSKPG